mgnify:CR=1 FL=1|jgi:hypothetical protein
MRKVKKRSRCGKQRLRKSDLTSGREFLSKPIVTNLTSLVNILDKTSPRVVLRRGLN